MNNHLKQFNFTHTHTHTLNQISFESRERKQMAVVAKTERR